MGCLLGIVVGRREGERDGGGVVGGVVGVWLGEVVVAATVGLGVVVTAAASDG